MNRCRLGLIVLLTSGLWFALPSNAACSGSGTVWSCTAGTTVAQITTMLSSASDGATATFDAGAYTWSTDVTFSMTKGMTLICASVGGCTVTGSNVLGMNGTCAGTSTKLYRVSGFAFSGNSNPRFWYYGATACLLTQVRLDHNAFTSVANDTTVMIFGENTSVDNYFYGVVDHNTLTSAGSVLLAFTLNGNSDGVTTGKLGTSSNLFFEDNTIVNTAMTDTGAGCLDGWGGHGIVWRHNTATNCLALQHGVTHTWGPTNFEVYANTFTHNSGSLLPDAYRTIHHQGSGTFIVFQNDLTPFSGHAGSAMALQHYRSFGAGTGQPRCDGTVSVDGNRSPTGTYYGYPCKRQPGRDVAATLFPIYAWSNRWTDLGTLIPLVCNDGGGETNPNTCVNHVVANRDYYNAVSLTAQTSTSSPFDGTTGMGFGTLARRPTTCTTGPEAADAGHGGVGYFATDMGAQGTLYRCSATNTWSTYYIPYAYPHPLVATATNLQGTMRLSGGGRIQ